MTKRTKTFVLALLTVVFLNAQKADKAFVQNQLNSFAANYEQLTANLRDSVKPPRTLKNGNIKCVQTSDWTSGFFASSLWYLYESTGNKKWLEPAKKWTAVLEKEKTNIYTHDLGFMLYCSFGAGLRLTNEAGYSEILVQGAKSLCERYRPKVGCIQSWEPWGGMSCPVIIDNMMNLEYLFWATRATGDSSFYKIAISHADTTIKNHFRPDFSSYHVVDYDSTNGQIIRKRTAQGVADESAWARGQAWGLYGYTMMYRETRNKKYLDVANKIAAFILEHQPADGVPYWDYNVAQNETEERDASAAAIAASAFFELCTYVDEPLSTTYFNAGQNTLKTLSTSNYFATPNEMNGFVLKHNVGHKPAHSEIDVPLIYADYYYLEALMRYSKF